jgi:hypothetical protein
MLLALISKAQKYRNFSLSKLSNIRRLVSESFENQKVSLNLLAESPLSALHGRKFMRA